MMILRAFVFGSKLNDPREMALAALWNSRLPLTSATTVATRVKSGHESSGDSKLCFYHQRFGRKARRCRPSCIMSSEVFPSAHSKNEVIFEFDNDWLNTQHPIFCFGANILSTPFGRYSAEISVLPATQSDRQCWPRGRSLTAANGSTIPTLNGDRSLSLVDNFGIVCSIGNY
ncbi:hypothetical protein ACOME3_005747 [Neoechinorhynchus agilis]